MQAGVSPGRENLSRLFSEKEYIGRNSPIVGLTVFLYGQPHNSFAHKKKYNEYAIDITFIFVATEKREGY